ncbi:MAG: hypothetical protein FWF81_10740 [Defluviitaleaceae bacterium]|nr:hypothetical protein [Defluviitaleaceae bacterium]
MKLGNPTIKGTLTDRKGANFFINEDNLHNSVPIFLADKLAEVEKSGITHGRMIFTTESPEEVIKIIKAYMYRKSLKIEFTRGKYFSKV